MSMRSNDVNVSHALAVRSHHCLFFDDLKNNVKCCSFIETNSGICDFSYCSSYTN